ncbi:histidine kinase [Desulfobacter hydrogenophilus]|uniref:histidine kinase n=1 Tax=Desulfobacter hydrogenophilus TaxID=2291 RepID=A0A328FFP8_9BACT|nr:ATP-binding protein [Desulfobacter hydrogenophilus]NDY70992.1 GAF domain-containing protein [Desulfobacter hydrogenophilus]QBH12769.1 response regulator [Desulfobacter hydrogenophilus]RAM03006.1 histidine kinase [Desulfobacter hydrogenophilus]
MSDKPSYEMLEQQIKRLETSIQGARRAELINRTLFYIASDLTTCGSLADLYASIYKRVSGLMDIPNFFIAIYHKEQKAIQYVFRRDAQSDFSPEWIYNFSVKPSLTGDVIINKAPLLLDEHQLMDLGAKGRVMGRLPKNWLGIPLMVKGEVIGVMAVKSYTNAVKYNEGHVELLSFVSDTIATAIKKKQTENELSKAKERLIRSQKLEAIATLAGGIAHDFNNTLSVTLGNINLAQMAAVSGTIRGYLDDAEQSVLQAKNLASKFVIFSSSSTVGIKNHINLTGFITVTLDQLKQEKNILSRLEVFDLPPVIEADSEALNEALKNVIINASEAMDNKYPVKITAQLYPKRKGMIVISITDQGRGIKSDHLEKIFNPYFSTKPKGGNRGTGLGLSIVWAIVKNHQGNIQIRSTLGQGTCVDIILPIFPKDTAKENLKPKAVEAKAVRPARVATRKPLVLCMDDDAMILEITEIILTQLGYEPVLAKSGEEAVEKYQACLVEGKIIGKVILDLEVKHGMGGEETMEKLLALNPGIKGIVASGYPNDAVMENYAFFGFSAALSKPFSIMALKQALENL